MDKIELFGGAVIAVREGGITVPLSVAFLAVTLSPIWLVPIAPFFPGRLPRRHKR
jgi:hypothetical protein